MLALLTGVDVVGAQAGTKISVDMVATNGKELQHNFNNQIEMLVQHCRTIHFGMLHSLLQCHNIIVHYALALN